MANTTHKTTLDVEGLTKQFGGLLAADGVTFQVSQNTVHGLIGPNGAGKTTVVQHDFRRPARDRRVDPPSR